jgi:HEAT repeat protein
MTTTSSLTTVVYVAARRRDTQALTRLLDEPSVRHLAARHLGRLGYRDAGPKLVELLSDQDRAVRLAAVRALGDLRASSARFALQAVAESDRDEGIRNWALVALGKTRDPEVTEYLVGELQGDEFERRRVAAFALGELGDPRALSPLKVARRREPLGRRFDFIRAWWKIRTRPTSAEK